MERNTNLKQVKNCSEDPRFLKLKLFQLTESVDVSKIFLSAAFSMQM